MDVLGNSDSKYSFKNVLMGCMIFVLLILIIINAYEFFFHINITAYIKDIFTDNPTLDINVNTENKKQTKSEDTGVPELGMRKQVFNIPGNHYNYENAKALCTAYGSELATYNQIEDSYDNGGEWCNYGWSANQMALFPTQKTTFDTLQTIEGHENDCGRAGINGGFIANQNVRFGVNCYGKKPRITKEEDELMQTSTPYPVSASDKAFQKRVDHWKGRLDQVLVSPFNYESWGK